MTERYGYYIFCANNLEARTADWQFVCLVTEEEDIIVFMLVFFGAHKLEDDGDTEYYESADWYYRVEWDYLDGEEQS